MSEVKNEIINELENSRYDLAIEEIAEKTGRHRNTISKYLQILTAEGRITCTRKVGRATFFDVPQPN